MIRSFVPAVLAICWAVSAAASDPARPDTGPLRDEVFTPALDAICGRGEQLSAGCAAIRARRIVEASQAPWSRIGRVNFASREVRQHCTGALVGERLVLTAAHCLYSFPRKAWIPASSLHFAAGYQRGQAVAQAQVRGYVLGPGQNTDSRDFRGGVMRDWALLELEEPIGRDLGFLPLVRPEVGEPVMLAGYAGLRPHVLSLAEDCGGWRPFESEGVALTDCSAMPGDSGAPLLVQREGELGVAGVFSTIVTTDTEAVYSLAVMTSVFEAAITGQ